jgi:hypothetical protein
MIFTRHFGLGRCLSLPITDAMKALVKEALRVKARNPPN